MIMEIPNNVMDRNVSGNITEEGNSTLTTIPLSERVVEATILSLICLIALIGNISLWIVITTSKHLCTTSNALVLCLSTADLLVSAINMPIAVYIIAYGALPFHTTICVVCGFITMLTFIASVMSLGTISINRYFMICHPTKFKAIYTKRNCGIFIFGTWLLSFLLATPPLYEWGSYEYLPGQSFCFCNWKHSASYTIFMVLVCFGGPCSVMSFSYIQIFKEVRDSKRRITANDDINSTLEGRQNKYADNGNESVLSDASDDTHLKERRRSSLTKPRVSFKSLKKLKQQLRNGNSQGENVMSESDNNELTEGHIATVSSSVSAVHSNQFLTVPGHRNIAAEIRAHKRAKRRKRRKEELRLTLSLLIVIIVFIICWLPFCVTMFLTAFSPYPVPRVPDISTLLLGFFNSTCNPLIYGLMNRKFKAGFQKLFCQCCKGFEPHTSSHEHSFSGSKSTNT